MKCHAVQPISIVHEEKRYADMKTRYPITSLLLILSVGCSSSVEQAQIEAKQNEERQRSIQVMQDTFIAASNSLRLVPMVPLVVTDILCNPCREVGRSNGLLTPNDKVELVASGSHTEREFDHHTDN